MSSLLHTSVSRLMPVFCFSLTHTQYSIHKNSWIQAKAINQTKHGNNNTTHSSTQSFSSYAQHVNHNSATANTEQSSINVFLSQFKK